LKHACLRHCRSPVEFVARYWRPGTGGAFRMGLQHGLFCLGCCWVLMVLLFYAGIMNLWWIGGLALYVALEKLAPAGYRVGRYTGGLLILWGAWVLAGAIVR
jgi:predicted metal-binding membrane protein